MRAFSMLLLALVLAACTTATPVAVVDRLAGSEWAPVRLGETPANVQVEQFVRFEAEGRVAGDSGCNRFTGGYTTADDRVEIGPLAVTRMACAPLQGDLERAFLDALDDAATFRRAGAVLALFDASGREVATFSQRDAD